MLPETEWGLLPRPGRRVTNLTGRPPGDLGPWAENGGAATGSPNGNERLTPHAGRKAPEFRWPRLEPFAISFRATCRRWTAVRAAISPSGASPASCRQPIISRPLSPLEWV